MLESYHIKIVAKPYKSENGAWYRREDVDKELALLRDVAKAALSFWRICDNESVSNFDEYEALGDALYNLEAADAAKDN